MPETWPAGKYPDGITGARLNADGDPTVQRWGKWYRLSQARTCAWCASTFFAIAAMRDGHLICGAICRDAWRASLNAEQVGAKNPAWLGGVSTDNMRYRRRQIERHPEREAAHRATAKAMRNGTLVRQPCEDCSNPRVHAHHDDYAAPLAVRWLCVRCHQAHHGHAVGVAPKAAAQIQGEAA